MDDHGFFRVRALAETPSTNDEVKRALDAGESEGLVVRALRQTCGYGRQGRAWASPEGGLYCSLLLRPQVDPAVLPSLSLVAGLAVRRAVVALAGEERAADAAAEAVGIKWPNDVVIALDRAPSARHAEGPCGKPARTPELGAVPPRAPRSGCAAAPSGRFPFAKLCGISLEAHAGGVCVGVGVNVRAPAAHVEVDGRNVPAYAESLAPRLARMPLSEALDRMCEELLARFAALYADWRRAGFAPLLDEYNAHAALAGRAVRVVDRTGALVASGTAERVDELGRLVLRDAAGCEAFVCSGEAHVLSA